MKEEDTSGFYTNVCTHAHNEHVQMHAIHLQIGIQHDKFMPNHVCTHINTCIHMSLGWVGLFLSDPWVPASSNNFFVLG